MAAHTVAREFGDEAHLDGTIHTTRLHTLMSASDDGRRWERIGVISTERLASECAFAFLPDGRAVGFLRHDLDQRPEIVVADPPYDRWRVAISVPFMYSGPCLGLVGDQIVVAGRAFFEDPARRC